MNRMSFTALAAALLLALSVPARADFVQGFESDTAGWSSNITRVPSGTGSIPAADGGYFATVQSSFTQWGGYNSAFPAAGYTTSVDIYLNVGGGANNDTRFDFTSAINNAAGDHRRDFVFNAGFYSDAVAPGAGNRFVISASNVAGRSNAYPKNPGRDPFVIAATGWYTFQHVFYNDGGVLAVDLAILDSSDTILKTWTLSDPSDVIGATVGGNRYGWFAANEFGTLAIDNSSMVTATAVPLPSAVWAGLSLLPMIVIRRRKR